MSRNSLIDDATLLAYLDGALDADARDAVEAALAESPELSEWLQSLRALLPVVAAALDDTTVPVPPVPSWTAIREGANERQARLFKDQRSPDVPLTVAVQARDLLVLLAGVLVLVIISLATLLVDNPAVIIIVGVAILLLIGLPRAFAAIYILTSRQTPNGRPRKRAQVEDQARELAEANELIYKQLDQQSQLLEQMTTLGTPVVPLADGMLFAPIVGHIDSRRAQALTARLLEQVSVQRARLVVLDIAGVAVVDTAVAQALLQAVQALRLLGCEVILSGVSASVALALSHLEVNLEEVRTVRSPQEALAQFLKASSQPSSDQPMQSKKDVLFPIKPNGQVPDN